MTPAIPPAPCPLPSADSFRTAARDGTRPHHSQPSPDRWPNTPDHWRARAVHSGRIRKKPSATVSPIAQRQTEAQPRSGPHTRELSTYTTVSSWAIIVTVRVAGNIDRFRQNASPPTAMPESRRDVGAAKLMYLSVLFTQGIQPSTRWGPEQPTFAAASDRIQAYPVTFAQPVSTGMKRKIAQ